MQGYNTSQLIHVALTYPAIDNHAHPLLKALYRDNIPFEGLVSEAQGPALTQDAPHTLACYRATAQLSNVLRASGEQIPAIPTWEAIKEIRAKMDYERLCKIFMEPSRIQCVLIDDGLGGSIEWAEAYRWHDQFTGSPTKRILRIEVLAEAILKSIFDAQLQENNMNPVQAHAHFIHRFARALQASATDPEVAGFKSIVCYRTGLNVELMKESPAVEHCITVVFLRYEATRTLRLSDKALNDYIVNVCLGIAATCGKPVQFHTGLGDNDITLTTSSPAVMQPLIKAFPNTKIVLLHSSYPYTREAGYLTAVYPNVFLDFGEVFPFVSADGQAAVLRQVLELCPTNKILWSTDGHWWPESYYLGTQQAREVLWKVLAESVTKQDMTDAQAIAVVKGALFDNANRIYGLGLEPKWFSGI